MNLFLSVIVNNDIDKVRNDVPVLTYLAGYCEHAIINLKLKCDAYLDNLTVDKESATDSHLEVISDFDRGGLIYPTADIINIITHNFIAIKKISFRFRSRFFKCK